MRPAAASKPPIILLASVARMGRQLRPTSNGPHGRIVVEQLDFSAVLGTVKSEGPPALATALGCVRRGADGVNGNSGNPNSGKP
jgi:hypothetical protein